MTRKKKWLIFSDPFPNIEWLADGILQSACQSLYVKESTTFKHEHRRMVYSLENKHEGSPECSSLYKYWNVLLKHTETNRKDVMLVHLWKVGKQECEVCCLVIRHEGTLFWKRDPDLLIPHPFLVAAKGKKWQIKNTSPSQRGRKDIIFTLNLTQHRPNKAMWGLQNADLCCQNSPQDSQ